MCSAADAGHTLGAAEAGGDAQAHLGLTELGLLGSDADVASHGQLAAAAQSEAVDGSDGGLLHSLQAQHSLVAQIAEVLAFHDVHGSHLADVSAGDEGTASAGDDNDIDLLVVLHHVERLQQGSEHSAAQCVQGLRAVHGHDTNVALLRYLYKCHRGIPPKKIGHTDPIFICIQQFCTSILHFSPWNKAKVIAVLPKKPQEPHCFLWGFSSVWPNRFLTQICRRKLPSIQEGFAADEQYIPRNLTKILHSIPAPAAAYTDQNAAAAPKTRRPRR